MPPQDNRQLPEPQQQPTAPESMPFIPPQLDYGSSISTNIKRLYMKRVAIIICAVLLVVGSGLGIYALINGQSNKATLASQDDKQGLYSGDGSDISDTKDATATWQCPVNTISESGEGATKECTVELTQSVEAKITTSCPSGYTEIDSNSGVSCQKHVGGYTETTNATASYSCPSGYSRSGTKCTHTDKRSPSTVYYCPSGYTLSGTSCTKWTTVYGNVLATCPDGFKKSGRGASATCTKTVNRNSNGTCPKGYTKARVNGKAVCVKTTSPSFACERGYTRTGTGTSTKCYKLVPTTIAASTKNVCPSGYKLSGSTCYRTTTINATVNYSCSVGYVRSGSKCLRYVGGTVMTVQATRKVSCPSGYTKTDDSQCEKKTQEVRPAEQVYQCDDGWELLESVDTGAKCVLTK